MTPPNGYDLTALWLMFALGSVAGLVAGAVLWLRKIGELRNRVQFLERSVVMEKEIGRMWQNQMHFEHAMRADAYDDVYLDTLGSRAGLLEPRQGMPEPWKTEQARKNAGELYAIAKRVSDGRARDRNVGKAAVIAGMGVV